MRSNLVGHFHKLPRLSGFFLEPPCQGRLALSWYGGCSPHQALALKYLISHQKSQYFLTTMVLHTLLLISDQYDSRTSSLADRRTPIPSIRVQLCLSDLVTWKGSTRQRRIRPSIENSHQLKRRLLRHKTWLAHDLTFDCFSRPWLLIHPAHFAHTPSDILPTWQHTFSSDYRPPPYLYYFSQWRHMVCPDPSRLAPSQH